MFDKKVLKSQKISKRPLQVAREIKIKLSDAFNKNQISDSVLFDRKFLISHVDVSSDLSWAKVYVYPFNNNIEPKILIESLKNSAGSLRTIIAKHLTTRKAPKLMFLIDEHFDKLEQVSSLINKASCRSEDQSNISKEE